MLLELNIRNIALIEKLRVEFGPGLNVLTGETGAGKSIVVDSVNLALGERADRELIRTGAEKASVQAVFEVGDNPRVLRLLDEFGLSDEDGLLVISRELSASGRNICRISGSVVPLSQLKQITALLVDVHGQHQHQSLMIPARHLHFLDCYGDGEHMRKMDEVRRLYGEYAEIKKRLEQFTGDKMERERRIDMLRFQLEEIEAVRVSPGRMKSWSSKTGCSATRKKLPPAWRPPIPWCIWAAAGRPAPRRRSGGLLRPWAPLPRWTSALKGCRSGWKSCIILLRTWDMSCRM